jgi:membrane-associated protein
VLFTLGFLIQGTNTVKLNLDINFVVFVLFIAAVAGACVGYLFGHKVGHRLFRRPNSLLFKQENIQKTKDFYDKYGGKTIIIARFIPIVRTFVPLIAGIAKMDFKVFMLFNILGGIIWTASVTYLGYFLGFWLTKMGIDVDAVILPIVLIILVTSVAPAIYKILRDEKQRSAIISVIKKHIFKR